MKETFLVDMKPFGGSGLKQMELKPEMAARMSASGIKIYPVKQKTRKSKV